MGVVGTILWFCTVVVGADSFVAFWILVPCAEEDGFSIAVGGPVLRYITVRWF